MTNAELEIKVRALAAEVAGLKEVLNRIFNHPDLTMEIRKKWSELTRPPVESPVSEPKPPEKGEAQRHLEYLQSFQTIFERNKENQNASNTSTSSTAR